MKTHMKDPSSELDFAIDWSAWLAAGETIVVSTWAVGAGLTDLGGATNADGVTTVWLGGGAAGEVYRVTNTIETSVGRVDSRTFSVRVVER